MPDLVLAQQDVFLRELVSQRKHIRTVNHIDAIGSQFDFLRQIQILEHRPMRMVVQYRIRQVTQQRTAGQQRRAQFAMFRFVFPCHLRQFGMYHGPGYAGVVQNGRLK